MEKPGSIVYGKKLKRVSLQRYLTSKLVYEANKVTPVDLIALYDNQLWLENKCLKDYDFDKKFGKSLEVLSNQLKEINLSQGLSSKALVRLSLRVFKNSQGFIVPPRNYQAYKARFSGLFQFEPMQSPGIAKRYLPQKKVIGIGYRDKGTLKRPWLDGSPSWQEVACQAGQLALRRAWYTKKIKEAKSVRDIEKVFKLLFEGDGKDQGTYYRGTQESTEEAEIGSLKEYFKGVESK